MFSILIADDEYLIRSGLTARLEYLGIVPDTVYEAADGKEALRIIRTKHPDIVITDIRMPLLDGLSLMERVKPDFPDIEFIILTGYAEFDYAKRAMKIGVHSYILKPISNEELKNALLNAAGCVKKHRAEKRAEAERLFLQYIQGSENSEVFAEIAEKIICGYTSGYKMLCIITGCTAAALSVQNSETLSENLSITFEKNKKKDVRAKNLRFFCFRDLSRASQYIAIFFSPASTEFTDTAALLLRRTLTELSTPQYPLIAACSEISKKISKNLYMQAAQIREYLCSAGNSEKKQVFFYSPHRTESRAKTVYTADISAPIKESRSGHTKISAAAEYLREHCRENISTAQTAEKYGFTANYFSAAFKKQTGCAFSEYIARLRIEQACAFLKYTDLNVREIAQTVGYADSQYFFRVFKKHTGLTPLAYRQKNAF